MSTVLPIVVAALLSGLVATGISIWYRDQYEARSAKIRLFQQLLGNRHVLLPGPHDPRTAAAFSEAVNQIFLLFHDAPPVLGALKAFHESISEQAASPELRNQRLLDLFKLMAKHVKVNIEPLGEGFFMKAFTVNSLFAPQPLNFEFQCLQFQDGQAMIAGLLSFAVGHKVSFVQTTDAAHLVGCTLIELAALARERDADLRRTGAIPLAQIGPDLMHRIQRRTATTTT